MPISQEEQQQLDAVIANNGDIVRSRWSNLRADEQWNLLALANRLTLLSTLPILDRLKETEAIMQAMHSMNHNLADKLDRERKNTAALEAVVEQQKATKAVEPTSTQEQQ